MMATNKFSKKGRNPAAIDNWLENLGYYRKNIAYDETCLFRAVSEQLYQIQLYHERVRNDCIEYVRNNSEKYINSDYFSNEDDLLEHLENLEKHMVICGLFEMQVISDLFCYDILLFEGLNQKINFLINKGRPKLMFCLMSEDHYDVVFECEHIKTAGFCQSMVYKILYQDVFDIPDIDNVVKGMLYDKTYITNQQEALIEACKMKDLSISDETSETPEDSNNNVNVTLNVAPFPFKIAKALDPTIYRNIEYDSWIEVRRELRLGEWYYGDDKLILGTKCVFHENNSSEVYECYIQEIIKGDNKCVIYITKLAEKRIVYYGDLSPENDPKPWPLPYRFSKNYLLPMTESHFEKHTKPKRKKEKKASKSPDSTSSSPSKDSTPVQTYIGAPLQMQTSEEEVTNLEPETPSHILMTPVSHTSDNVKVWDQPYYSIPSVIVPTTPDSFSWPQSPIYNFNMQPVFSPLPSTPNVMSYYDIPQPVYNYQPDESWSNPQENVPNTETYNNQKSKKKITINTTPTIYPQQCAEYQENQSNPIVNETLLCAPNYMNQTIGIYSPIVPMSPGTPLILGNATDIPGVILPGTPVPLYTPPVELAEQCYVPTVSNPWYPMGVNSQGFIFPTVATSK